MTKSNIEPHMPTLHTYSDGIIHLKEAKADRLQHPQITNYKTPYTCNVRTRLHATPKRPRSTCHPEHP